MTKCAPGMEPDKSEASGSTNVPVDCRNCGAYHLCMSLWLKTGDSSLLERVVKRKQVLKRGEVLYRMGQQLEYIYVIRGGSIKTCVGRMGSIQSNIRARPTRERRSNSTAIGPNRWSGR